MIYSPDKSGPNSPDALSGSDLIETLRGRDRWTVEQANDWYAQTLREVGAPLTGCNFIPSDAGNQLDMWQTDTFNPALIDTEMSWMKNYHMNLARVFLHDLAWQQDPTGFKDRMETYLKIAEKYDIKTMFVFFDSCWNDNAKTGPQTGYQADQHNSMWLQSPNKDVRSDINKQGYLEAYVKDVIFTYKDDKRVLAWDMYNEPCNLNNYSDPIEKLPQVHSLMNRAIGWARQMAPTQPLTTGPWMCFEERDIPGDQFAQSDIISFHSYDAPEILETKIAFLQKFNRPIICSEHMVRGFTGNELKHTLPIFKKYNVASTMWGFVNGRTNTNVPWEKHKDECWKDDPTLSFHDLLNHKGEPLDPDDIIALKKHATEEITDHGEQVPVIPGSLQNVCSFTL